MKSKTSFFNGMIFKKDLTRFFPLWLLYSIFLFLTFFLDLTSEYKPEDICITLLSSGFLFGMINMLYALLCVTNVFGDLYVSKLCNPLHALPIRRESWFFIHSVSAFCFSLIPNTVLALLIMPLLKSYFYVALIWLAIMQMSFLFFFGLAVFCGFLAASKRGTVFLYGIFNFISITVYAFINIFYIPHLRGVVLDNDIFIDCFPMFRLILSEYYLPYDVTASGTEEWNGENLLYLFILAIIGFALLAAAYLLYQHRKLETAGDLLSVPAAAPVFLLFSSLISGMILYSFSSVFIVGFIPCTLFFILGIAVGFFGGLMLLERSIRVFHKKNLLIFVGAVLLLLLSLFCTKIDILGISKRIPAIHSIESCSLCPTYDNLHYSFTDEKDMELVRKAHKELLEEADQEYPFSSYQQIEIIYHLKSGNKIVRSYPLYPTSKSKGTIRKINQTWQCVLETDNPEELLERIAYIKIDALEHSQYFRTEEKEFINGLLYAIQQDCMEEHFPNFKTFDIFDGDESTITFLPLFSIEFEIKSPHSSHYNTSQLSVYPESRHTLSYLKEHIPSSDLSMPY